MIQILGQMRVVAEIEQDGKTILVDCAIREKDVTQEVILFLLEQASGEAEAAINEVVEALSGDALGG